MSDDNKPEDAIAPGEDKTAEADFAASESDMQAEAAPAVEASLDDAQGEGATVAETSPAEAPAAEAPAAAAPRPIWSDDGDAPFDDGEPETPVRGARASRATKAKGETTAGGETLEIIKTVSVALLIALVLRILVFQPFTIPSASMEPNLYEGDYIVVSKWSYGYSRHAIPFSPALFEGRIMGGAPQRGDIVVFKLPRDNSTDYIKRVIGLPGDRVQMRNNQLYLNDVAVENVVVDRVQVADMFGPRGATRLRETLPGGRSYTIEDRGPGYPLDDTPVFVVPAGHYFMMGDNRDNSIDSRDPNGGLSLVPEENLVGKAQIILFSWSPGASLLNPVSWFSKVRFSRFFHSLD